MADDSSLVSRVMAKLDVDISPAQSKFETLQENIDQFGSAAVSSYERFGAAFLQVQTQMGSQLQELSAEDQAKILQIEQDGELKRQMAAMAFQQQMYIQQQEFSSRMQALESESQATRDSLMQQAAIQTLAIMSQAELQQMAILEESALKKQALDQKAEQAEMQHQAKMSILNNQAARDYVDFWKTALAEEEALDKSHYQAIQADRDRDTALLKQSITEQMAEIKAFYQMGIATAEDSLVRIQELMSTEAEFFADNQNKKLQLMKTEASIQQDVANQELAIDKAYYRAIQDDRDQDSALQEQYVTDQLARIKTFYEQKLATAQQSMKDMDDLVTQEYDFFIQNQDKQLQALKMYLTMQQDLESQPTLGGVGSVRSKINGTNTGFSTSHMIAGMVGFSALTGAYEQMVQGMKDVENGAAGLDQVFETQITSQSQLNSVTNDFVGVAQKYGESINDVMNGAKQWGRQYKDIQTAMTLTNSSTLLAVVDNVQLADANKGLEATMNAMGLAATDQASAFANSMRIVDSWSALAHQASVSANDLMQATERSAGAAHAAGVSFDQLQALITSAVRNTGLAGSNIGTMLKTLFTSIHTEKAEADLKQLGVSLTQVGQDGQTAFRPIFDVLLELSQKLQTTDQSQQQLLKTISGGSQQYSKVAAMLTDYNTIIDAYATSLNSAGAAQQYAQVQMHTLERDIQRLQDTFAQLAAQTDQNGLGKFLKDIVEGLTNLIVGLEQMPPAAGQTLFIIGGLVVALKSFVSIMNTMDKTVLGVSKTIDFFRAISATTNSTLQTLTQTTKAATTETESQTAATEAATAATEAKNVASGEAAIAAEAQAATSGAVVAGLEAETAATAETTAAFTALDVVSGGLLLVIGAIVTSIGLYASSAGSAAQATRDHTQALQDQIGVAQQDYNLAQQKQQFMQTAIEQEAQLKKALEDTTLSAENRNKTMQDLIDLYHAVGKATGDEALDQVNASNVKNQSLAAEEKKLQQLVDDKKKAYDQSIQINEQEVQSDLKKTQDQINLINQHIQALQTDTLVQYDELSVWGKFKYSVDMMFGDQKDANGLLDDAKNSALDKAQQDMAASQKQLADDEKNLADMKLQSFQLDTGDITPGDQTAPLAVDAGWDAPKQQSASSLAQPYSDQVSAMQEALTPFTDQTKQLDTALASLTARQDALSTSLKYGSTNMQLASEAADVLQQRLATLNEHQQSLHATNEQIRADEAKIQSSIQALNPTGAAVTSLSQGQQDAIKSLQQELSNLQTQESDNSTKWQDDIKSMISAEDDWANSLKQLQANQLAPLDQQLKDLQNQLKSTQAQMSMDDNEIKHGDTSYGTLTDYAKQYLTQLSELQQEEQTLGQQQAMRTQQLQQLQTALNGLDKNTVGYDEAAQDLTQQINDQKSALADLADQMAQTSASVSSLKDSYEQLIEDGLKAGYQAEQQFQDQKLKDKFDSQTQAIQSQIDALDQQINAYDQLVQAQSEAEKLADLQNQLTQVESQHNQQIVGTDGKLTYTYDVQKATDLQTQITDEQTQIQQTQYKQQLQDQKQALQDKLKSAQDEYSKEKDALDSYWTYRQQQDQLQQDADRLIAQKGYAQALADATQFKNNMNAQFAQINWAQIQQGGNVAAGIKGGVVNAGANTPDLSQLIKTAGSEWQQAATQAQKDAIHQQLVNQLQGSGAVYNSGSGQWSLDGKVIGSGSSSGKIAAAETGAYIPDGKQGLVFLHQNEVVANSPMVDNFKVVPPMLMDLQAKMAELPSALSPNLLQPSGATTVQQNIQLTAQFPNVRTESDAIGFGQQLASFGKQLYRYGTSGGTKQ